MLLFARTSWLLFTTHVGRVFRSRRALICLALALFPAAVAAAIGHFSVDIDPLDIVVHLGGMLLMQIIVPILALIAGSAVVSEEVEDRTITYLFSRPIPRPALLLGRWMATLVFLATTLLVSTWLLVLAASTAVAEGPVLNFASSRPLYEAVLLGAAVYSAIFAVLGVFFRHPILVGLGYTFAIEGFLANLPGANQKLTIQYYLRSWIIEQGGAAWKIETLDLATPEKPAAALMTLGGILIFALALGSWRLARKEFVLTS